MEAEIVVDLDSLRLSEASNVTGITCVRFDSVHFPERDWFDFPGILLAWWIRSFVDESKSSARDVTLDFMEGPFSLKLVREAGGAWSASAFRGARLINDLGQVDGEELYSSALLAARRLLEFGRSRGWATDDLRDLQTACDQRQ